MGETDQPLDLIVKRVRRSEAPVHAAGIRLKRALDLIVKWRRPGALHDGEEFGPAGRIAFARLLRDMLERRRPAGRKVDGRRLDADRGVMAKRRDRTGVRVGAAPGLEANRHTGIGVGEQRLRDGAICRAGDKLVAVQLAALDHDATEAGDLVRLERHPGGRHLLLMRPKGRIGALPANPSFSHRCVPIQTFSRLADERRIRSVPHAGRCRDRSRRTCVSERSCPSACFRTGTGPTSRCARAPNWLHPRSRRPRAHQTGRQALRPRARVTLPCQQPRPDVCWRSNRRTVHTNYGRIGIGDAERTLTTRRKPRVSGRTWEVAPTRAVDYIAVTKLHVVESNPAAPGTQSSLALRTKKPTLSLVV